MTKAEFEAIAAEFPVTWKYSKLDQLYVWNHAGHVSAKALQTAAVEMAGQTGGYATRPRPADLVRRAIEADRPEPVRVSHEQYSSGCARREVWQLAMSYVVDMCNAGSHEARRERAMRFVSEGPAVWPEAGAEHWARVRKQFGIGVDVERVRAEEPANW